MDVKQEATIFGLTPEEISRINNDTSLPEYGKAMLKIFGKSMKQYARERRKRIAGNNLTEYDTAHYADGRIAIAESGIAQMETTYLSKPKTA